MTQCVKDEQKYCPNCHAETPHSNNINDDLECSKCGLAVRSAGVLRVSDFRCSSHGDITPVARCPVCYSQIIETHHQELQKARHDWLREEIVKLVKVPHKGHVNYHQTNGYNQAIKSIRERYQAELNQHENTK